MTSYLPALVALAALALTYRFCIRPMRTGTCAMATTAQTPQHKASRRELELARNELELLRAREKADNDG